jgi:hypothetical protein
MFEASQKPLHGHSDISQLDVVGHLLALKSWFGLSQDGFDELVKVIGDFLLKGHILPKSLYHAKKLLHALKMPYDQIHACLKGASYLGKIIKMMVTEQSVGPLGT